VSGGDGSVTIGDAAHVIGRSTSLDRNLNERGYDEYTVDPDTFCGTGSPPPPPPPSEEDPPAYGELYPTDPACNVD
jgi:hypothetical protein